MSAQVSRRATRASADGPLKLAVPRGALFDDTLEVLDARRRRRLRSAQRLALADLRRRRPGAGDDAPLRRPHLRRGGRRRRRHHRQGRAARAVRPRWSTSCSTSATANAGWCSPGAAGTSAWASRQRRLGAMRIATKYPRIAERHFEATGRQAEVIEVKGSVELAPLVGLADGIVDLVATGRTLEENDLEVREEIARCTARFVANRVAHKLRAAEVDELTDAAARGDGPMRVEALRMERTRGGRAASVRAWLGAARRARRSRRDPRRRPRAAATQAVLELTRRFDATERAPAGLRVDPAPRRRPRSIGPRPGAARALWRPAAANIRAVAEAQLDERPRAARAAAGPSRRGAGGCRSAPPASTRRADAPRTPRAS